MSRTRILFHQGKRKDHPLTGIRKTVVGPTPPQPDLCHRRHEQRLCPAATLARLRLSISVSLAPVSFDAIQDFGWPLWVSSQSTSNRLGGWFRPEPDIRAPICESLVVRNSMIERSFDNEFCPRCAEASISNANCGVQVWTCFRKVENSH